MEVHPSTKIGLRFAKFLVSVFSDRTTLIGERRFNLIISDFKCEICRSPKLHLSTVLSKIVAARKSRQSASSKWKKMAAVHFTTMPCEPSTANRQIESNIFCEIRPCVTTLRMLGLKVLKLFCAFL